MAKNLTVLCTYRVKKAREKDFLRLLRAHWPALHSLGLATDEPAVAYRRDEGGGPVYHEIFTWKSVKAVRSAHAYPEVSAIWEPMEGLCETRGALPAMDFPHVERVKLRRGA